MSRPGVRKLATVAAILSLIGLAFIVWSVIHPAPLAVVAAMTIGQAVGTASLVVLIAAIALDLARAGVIGSRGD